MTAITLAAVIFIMALASSVTIYGVSSGL